MRKRQWLLSSSKYLASPIATHVCKNHLRTINIYICAINLANTLPRHQESITGNNVSGFMVIRSGEWAIRSWQAFCDGDSHWLIILMGASYSPTSTFQQLFQSKKCRWLNGGRGYITNIPSNKAIRVMPMTFIRLANAIEPSSHNAILLKFQGIKPW